MIYKNKTHLPIPCGYEPKMHYFRSEKRDTMTNFVHLICIGGRYNPSFPEHCHI